MKVCETVNLNGAPIICSGQRFNQPRSLGLSNLFGEISNPFIIDEFYKHPFDRISIKIYPSFICFVFA